MEQLEQVPTRGFVRMILESVVFFALLLITTLVIASLPRAITAHAWLAVPLCLVALAGAGAAFLEIERDEPGMATLGIVAIVLVVAMRLIQPRWSFVGAQLFVAVSVAAMCYLAYASLQTFLRWPAAGRDARVGRAARSSRSSRCSCRSHSRSRSATCCRAASGGERSLQ